MWVRYNKTLNDMAKVQIKSEKPTPFGGFFSIMELFNALLAQTIDSILGLSNSALRTMKCRINKFWP